MFEELDKINWEDIGYHIWGNSKDYLAGIPEKIRELNSPDENVQDGAMTYLFGEKGAFGDICDTTPYIIPFVIEFLENPATPRRHYLLDYLLKVADYLLSFDHLSVQSMRLHLNVYDSITRKIDALVRLLDDETKEICLSSIELLGKLTDNAETLLPEFFRRLDSKPDDDLQVAILKSIKGLLGSLDPWTQEKVKEKYAPLLRDIVDTSSSRKVQLAAARASVETINRYRRDKNILSEKVQDLLSQEFLRHTFSQFFQGHIHIVGRMLDESVLIARDLMLFGYESLLTLVKNSETDAVQAHILARSLLASVLMSDGNIVNWKFPVSHINKAIYYLPNYRIDDLRVATRIDTKKEAIRYCLQAIIENEKIWELPTNLFSFFFGLPDSHDELQKILKEIS